MTYDLPQRLSHIADVDVVSADTSAFITAVDIDDAARTLADAMCDPDDAEELYGALASLWLELRLQWQRHNDVANYDLMRHGEAKPIDLVRGSISSYYFQRIESLLQPDQIQCLNQRALSLIDSLRHSMSHPDEAV